MKYGLSFLPDADGKDLSAHTYFQTALHLAELADQAQLNVIKMTEHYLHPYGGYCPDPISFLSAVAAKTKNIRLMTGGILPAFHHPITIAAKTAMLDVISNQRLDVGFARAYLPYEFAAFQVPMNESRERFEQTIAAVIALWTQENVNIQTRYFHLQTANSYPKPLQTPHPPVWGAAVMSRQSFASWGEKGFHLLVTPSLNGIDDLQTKIELYKQTFQAHHPEKKSLVSISLPLLIAPDSQQAEKLAHTHLKKYIAVWSDAVKSWSKVSSQDYPGYSYLHSILTALTPEKMQNTFQAIFGSPEQVIECISQMSSKLSIDQIMWQMDFGAQASAISYQTFELFIQRVLPKLRFS